MNMIRPIVGFFAFLFLYSILVAIEVMERFDNDRGYPLNQ